MSVKVDLSVGELVDKITILEIKSERIEDEEKLINVNKELSVLRTVYSEAVRVDISDEYNRLKEINIRLWIIEDDIRDKEFNKEFDDKFIELARAVYVTNDDRADVKKEINIKTGSELTEEKSYQDYK